VDAGGTAGARPAPAAAEQPELLYINNFGKTSGLVIGRTKDLTASGALQGDEYTLGWYPVEGTSGSEGEWAVNRAKLQDVMKLGLPIRDASPLDDMQGWYLNRERGLLLSSNWTCHGGYWIPPKP
jgi:hypothetical protein